jgi:tRNA threonylcarbamoyladenosine biosynthesis protein TsaB
VRVLGIETSSRRGSVALLEGERAVKSLAHEEPNSHAERLLPLLEQLLSEAGWSKSSLDRIAVGRGPGSFVGLRVGIALAEGLGLGLGRPVVGVPSLAAMLGAVSETTTATRVAVTDARRSEFFVYAARPDGSVVLEVQAIPRASASAALAGLGEVVLVGEAASELPGFRVLRGAELDLPHALLVARLAFGQPASRGPVLPLYVRGAGATTPNLPPSPFAGG